MTQSCRMTRGSSVSLKSEWQHKYLFHDLEKKERLLNGKKNFALCTPTAVVCVVFGNMRSAERV